jgi:tripartite-type tricarboxylate transporter receptor subunit TctC
MTDRVPIMSTSLSRTLGAGAAVLAAIALVPQARAQDFPTRQITIMPLLAAGTGLDVTVRLYAEQLSQTFGKPVVVENKPGSAGLIGIAALKAAPPDGHTLVVATSGAMAIRPWLLKHTPYDAQKDFVPIALYVKSPFILVVDPKLPVHSVAELIKYVKDRPGQISYSSPGVGGAPHLALEFMKQRFGFDAAHVPYRNSPQSIADVAAGHVAMAFAEAGASLPLIRDGKLRALAVTSSTRLSTVPDLPPIGEVVGAPDFETVSWHVLLAHAATPRPIVDKLHGEMKRILEAPEMRKKIAAIGLLPIDIASVDDSRRYIAAEGEKWGALVKTLGLQGSQ